MNVNGLLKQISSSSAKAPEDHTLDPNISFASIVIVSAVKAVIVPIFWTLVPLEAQAKSSSPIANTSSASWSSDTSSVWAPAFPLVIAPSRRTPVPWFGVPTVKAATHIVWYPAVVLAASPRAPPRPASSLPRQQPRRSPYCPFQAAAAARPQRATTTSS